MSKSLSVLEKNGKFVVTKNGEPIQLPKTDGQTVITAFDTKEDAERYLSILMNLLKKK